MKYKHNWEVVGQPGMYETEYHCIICDAYNEESIDEPYYNNPVYGCTPPKEQDQTRLIPVVPDKGWFDLPNGCTMYWKENDAGGRTYTSNEVGIDMMVWDTALTDDSTLMAAMTQEASLQRLERYWAEQRAKNK